MMAEKIKLEHRLKGAEKMAKQKAVKQVRAGKDKTAVAAQQKISALLDQKVATDNDVARAVELLSQLFSSDGVVFAQRCNLPLPKGKINSIVMQDLEYVQVGHTIIIQPRNHSAGAMMVPILKR